MRYRVIVVAWPARLHPFPILYESGCFLCKFWTPWSTGGLTGVKIALKIENLLPNQQANPPKVCHPHFSDAVQICICDRSDKKLGNKYLSVSRVSHAPAVDRKVAVAGRPGWWCSGPEGQITTSYLYSGGSLSKMKETAMIIPKILKKLTSIIFSNIFLMGCVQVRGSSSSDSMVNYCESPNADFLKIWSSLTWNNNCHKVQNLLCSHTWSKVQLFSHKCDLKWRQYTKTCAWCWSEERTFNH